MENEQDTEVLNSDEQLDSNQESEDVGARLTKAEEIAKNQRIRAEKAEKELKALKETPKTDDKEAPKQERSIKDIVREGKALSDLDNDEDIDEVIEYAERKKISLSDARKSPFIKSFLQTQTEMRKSAEMSNVGTQRKATKKEDPLTMVDRMSRNEVPDDDDGINALVQAEQDLKRSRNKR